METELMRGVPLAMKRDGCWLDGSRPSVPPRWRTGRKDWAQLALLLVLIALGDVLVWQVMPGISLALMGAAIVAAGMGVAWPRLTVRSRVAIALGAALCLLPLVELLQPLSVLIAFAGLSVICAALAGVQRADLVRAALRLWWIAPAQTAQDGVAGLKSIATVDPKHVDLKALITGWALPLGATVVFAVLLIGANPVLDQILADLSRFESASPDGFRLVFWGILAAVIWPVLIAYRMQERLRYRAPERITVKRQGVVNAGSVARSLIAFNALFAVQSGMDALYLYGDATLPEGISPAAYAHRGAYPLLATALLAGVFAVLARPHLTGRPIVRGLMYLWLAQTLALVFASLWRLDIYVDTFGLTRLRIAAYIWMGLVAIGLGIVVVQIWRDKPTSWMLVRSGALGAVALYICAFVNFDGIVAEHNLTHPVPRDPVLLCRLSEGALPAMVRHWDANPIQRCLEGKFQHYEGHVPSVFHPTDWREWGFRNWRVRRSLAAMTDQSIQQ